MKNLEEENEELKARVLELAAALTLAADPEVNGYNFVHLMEKSKKLLIDHGGWQNGYAISRAIQIHEEAAKLISHPQTHWLVKERELMKELEEAAIKILSIYPGLFFNDQPVLSQALAAVFAHRKEKQL